MKALLVEENLPAKSRGEFRNVSISYFSLIRMAAVALGHVSQRNTAPNFQGKHTQNHRLPLEDFGDSEANRKALTFLGVILPESSVCGPFTDCPVFTHLPRLFLSEES